MKYLTAVTAALLLSGCWKLPGAGVVKIPKSVISDDDIQSLSAKYTAALCPEKPVMVLVDGVKQADPSCPVPNEPRKGSWLALIKECGSATKDVQSCRDRRNSMIAEMMLIVDHNYHQYEGNIIAGQSKTNFYSDGLRTSLETAATLFNPMSTVKILTGTAALTGTVQASATKEFYYDQAANALIAQMRADRKEIELRILSAMLNSSYEQYPVPMALRDLNELYRAGTLASAITTVSKDATTRAHQADEEMKGLTNQQLAKNGQRAEVVETSEVSTGTARVGQNPVAPVAVPTSETGADPQ